MKKILHFLIPVVLVVGIVCVVTAIASAPSCAVGPRSAYGSTPTDGQATPMGGVFLTCQCVNNNQIRCLGQDGQWHTISFCPNGCNTGFCH